MQNQADHSTMIEAPETVTAFLKFINANGPVVSREWFYGKLGDGTLPRLKIGRKIFIMRSEILARMRELGEK